MEENKPKKTPPKKPFWKGFREKCKQKKDAFFSALDERGQAVKSVKKKRVIFFCFSAFLLLLVLAFYLSIGKIIVSFIQDSATFKEWLDGFGFWSVVIFIFLRIVQTVTKLLPGSAIEIAAGFIFGAWWGFVWCMVGSFLGSILILWIGRRYGVKAVGLFVDPERLQVAEENRKRRNWGFFLMYFLPVTPKDIFTWLESLTDNKFVGFMTMSMLARIPSILISTFCGASVMNENYALSFWIFGGLVLFTVVGAVVYRLVVKKRKKEIQQKKEEETEEE